MSKLINTLIVFKIIKMLTTPFEKTKAYELGLIDKFGSRIKSKKVETTAEKSAFTMLDRLVFNLKRVIEKVPFGKSKFASYAIALALLKEETKMTARQTDELCEDFYKYLKEYGLLEVEDLTEAAKIPTGLVGETYRLRRQLKEQNDKIYPEKTEIQLVGEHSIIYGIKLYVGKIEEDRVLVTADDLY